MKNPAAKVGVLVAIAGAGYLVWIDNIPVALILLFVAGLALLSQTLAHGVNLRAHRANPVAAR